VDLRRLAWIIPLAAGLAVAQTSPTINCKRPDPQCQIEIGGQTLTFGMPKDLAMELLSRTPYRLTEDRIWSADHKPVSLWQLTIPEHQPFAGVIKGGVKFRGEKLDGAMVLWSPDSDEQSDFAASLINLLERFSNEGSTSCTLSTTKTPRPQQEDRDATFECGLRSISVSHTRFQATVQGQKVPDYAAIYEMLGNW
jgi:hypothetical protein